MVTETDFVLSPSDPMLAKIPGGPAGRRIRKFDAVLLAAGGAVKLHIDHQHYERIRTTTTSPPPRPEHGDDDDICGMTPGLGPRPQHGSDDAATTATIHPNNCATITTRIVARCDRDYDGPTVDHAHWQHDDHHDESPQPSRHSADLDL
ncbi:hypothetical protein BDZ89DRAFT_1067936 [Hymenopellis radicata]|nr:hypothetical protein BDZ89DRAFT_1067936 [Hymenopellis radicata]